MRGSLPACSIPLVFAKPIFSQVVDRVRMIAHTEGMAIDDQGIEKLYHGCNGDLRQMITSLQMWSHDGKATRLDGQGITERLKTQHKEILTKNIFDVVREVFDGPSQAKPRGPTVNDRLDSFFMDIDMAPMWTQQAYPSVVSSINCQGKVQQARALWYMSRCADSISDSDLVQQQIRGAQNWGLLPLYGLTSTAKVGALVGNFKGAPVNPQFPLLLGQISKGNKRERILREAAMHTSGVFTGGARVRAMHLHPSERNPEQLSLCVLPRSSRYS
jgi:replication factor C subunit 1